MSSEQHRVAAVGHSHGGEHCCCAAIEALGCAAAAIHDQHCCCEEDGDKTGCECCEKSLGLVLDAIDAHVACLRGMCGAMSARGAGGAAGKKK